MANFVNLTWFLSLSLFFNINKGHIYFPTLLLLAALFFSLYNFKNKELKLDYLSSLWAKTLLLVIVLATIPKIILKEDYLAYSHIKHIAYCFLLLILFIKYKPSLKVYFSALFFSIIIFNAYIIYHKFISDFPDTELNLVIKFFPFHTLASDFLILWASLIFGLAIYFYKQKDKFLMLLAFFAGIWAILGAVLAGGRGSFLLIPASLVILMLYLSKEKKGFFKNLIIAAMLIFSTFTLLYFIPQTNLKNRLESFSDDFEEYAEGNPKTSQGMRIELYKCGFTLAKNSPIYGLGETKQVLEEMGEKKFCHFEVRNFPHFHNDFIEQYMHYGILGALALSLLLFSPLIFGIFALRRGKLDEISKLFAYSAIVLSSCYFFAGLSDKFLLYKTNLNFYLLLEAFLMSGIKINREIIKGES